MPTISVTAEVDVDLDDFDDLDLIEELENRGVAVPTSEKELAVEAANYFNAGKKDLGYEAVHRLLEEMTGILITGAIV